MKKVPITVCTKCEGLFAGLSSKHALFSETLKHGRLTSRQIHANLAVVPG